MNGRRISGIIILIIGIVMYFFSNYITDQVNEGKKKVSNAQKKVNQGNSLFSLNPYTKEIGKAATNPAQQEINEGEQQISEYEQIAHWLYVGGVVVVILGAGIFVISFVGKGKNRR
jgi:hypothetical protein